MLPIVGFVLATAFPQCPLPSENRILDQFQTGFPFSVPNAMAVSADGRYIYCGEGGSIAILDTEANPPVYDMTAPRPPISDFGARPAKILVDPGTLPGTDDDLLIICAGRSGLWVMDAHPTGGADHRAAVVDDAGGSNVNVQNSRRFCDDAEIFSIDGVEYLAAIFARRGGSRLRIYDMESVRAVLVNTMQDEWSGAEISYLHDRKFGKRVPTLSPIGQTNLHNYSLSIALTVDQISADSATVYVALWHQGLARVRVDADPGNPGELLVSGVELGPVFGDGSAYHLHENLSPHPKETYDNFHWTDVDTGEVTRQEPPVFTDVAVQNFQAPNDKHYLYATVDTLGWVRFDLSDPWGADMMIEHHEGTAYPEDINDHPFGEIQFELNGGYSYPTQVRVIESQGEVLVAVNMSGASMVRNVGHRTEGSVLNYAANSFNGIPDYFFLKGNRLDRILGGTGEVLIYRVDTTGTIGAFTGYEFDADLEPTPDPGNVEEEALPTLFSQFGGRDISFHPASPGVPNRPLLFVQAGKVTDKVRVDLDPPLPEDIMFERLGGRVKADRPGSERFRVGYCVVNPDVLLVGSNDGFFSAHGIHALCGSDLLNFYDPSPGGADGRFNAGIYFDHEGQWPVLDEGTSGERAGMQISIGGLDGNRYRVHLLDPGDPCGVPQVEPDLIHTWRIGTPTDRFKKQKRWYIGGTVNEAYDAEIGQNMLYMAGSNTPQGIVAIDRDEFEEWLFDNTGTGASSDLHMDNAGPDVIVGTLNTDPELSKVPNTPATEEFLQTLYFDSDPSEKFNIAGGLLTFAPRIVKVPSTQGGTADTWVLAAQCGFLENGQEKRDVANKQFAAYEDNNGVPIGEEDWTADSEVGDMTRLVLQFWDISDPDTFDDTEEARDYGVPANVTLIGDLDFANALSLKVEEWGNRTYIFVADYGGCVLVYDMTDVLWNNQTPIELVETYTPAKSLTDSLPNAVWDVVVDRAQWISGLTPMNEIYVYAAVERLGVEVLRFDPSCPLGDRLKKVRLIQTPGNVRSMIIRGAGSDRSLILSDGEAGLRVLEYNF